MEEQVAAGFPYGGIAQLGEHLPCKQGVKGSNPFISTEEWSNAKFFKLEKHAKRVFLIETLFRFCTLKTE